MPITPLVFIGSVTMAFKSIWRKKELNTILPILALIIRRKFGISIEGLYGKHPSNVRSTIRALQVLWDYSEYGTMVIKVRPGRKPFECLVVLKKVMNRFRKSAGLETIPQWARSRFSVFFKSSLFLWMIQGLLM